MSTYKNLIGKDVNFLSTDPDNDAAEGQIWYNSTSGVFKDLLVNEAWSSGGSMIVGRRYFAGCGTQTAGLAFGGNHTGSDTDNNTEEYNGSGWANGGNLTTGRAYLAGCGTQTAGLAFGGGTHPSPATQAITEEYNGSSWSEQNDMSTARRALAGAGTQTSALAFGGSVPPTLQTATEEYGGTSWTSGGAMSTARKYLAGAGASQTVALAFGGMAPGATNATEEYDGSSWTTGGSLNTSRGYLAGAGTQTAALAMLGYNDKTNTEAYDGTSWSNKPAATTGREGVAGCGTTTAGLVFGGKVSDVVSNTEEFTGSVNVITGAAWAAGGAYPISVFSAKFVGDKDAGLGFAGYNAITTTCEYNGSSWTNVPSLPAGGGFGLGFAGTQTAGLAWNGYSGTFGGGAFNPTTAYEYNGSSWTSGGATPFQGRDSTGFGTQTAAIGAGGYTQTPAQPPTGVGVTTNKTVAYDGSSWTNVNSLNTAREVLGGFGTQTAGVAFGGQQPPANNLTEDWDGTNWTASNTMNIGRRNVGGFGTQTEGYAVGGRAPNYPSPNSNFVEEYNGSSWVTSANLATGRSSIAVASSLAGPGQSGSSPYAPLIEEFTGETSALNIRTITTS